MPFEEKRILNLFNAIFNNVMFFREKGILYIYHGKLVRRGIVLIILKEEERYCPSSK